MKHNGPSKSNSSRKFETSYLFTGGSSIEFAKARSKIERVFVERSCYDYVRYPIPKPAGYVPVESTFDAVEPTFQVYVTDKINALQLEATNNRGNKLQFINLQLAGATGTERAAATLKVENDHLDNMFGIEKMRASLESSFESAHVNWTKAKNNHEEKLGRSMSVYNEKLSPTVQAFIKGHLDAQHVRAAWVALDDHYKLAVGGQQNVQQVMEFLSSATYRNGSIWAITSQTWRVTTTSWWSLGSSHSRTR